jgi:hypothetical protein
MLAGSVYGFSVTLNASLPIEGGAPKPVTSTTYIAVSITATPIVALVQGGSGGRVVSIASATGVMKLDASPSYDPDVANSPSNSQLSSNSYQFTADAAMTFQWTCYLVASQTSCPSEFDSYLNVAKVAIPNSLLVSTQNEGDSQIQFGVTITKGSRTATLSAPIVVTLSQLPLPSLSVQLSVPTQPNGYTKINPGDKVALSAVISSTTQLAKYTYRWISTSSLLVFTGNTDSRIGTSLTSSTLVLLPNSLSGGATYSFMVTLTSVANPSMSVSANVSFSVNAAPANGACSSSPESGTALVTSFNLACSGFSDDPEDLPLSYSFSVVPAAAPAYELRGAQSVSAYSTVLSAASPLNMMAKICDLWGACSSYAFSANVTMQDVKSASVVASLASSVLSSLDTASSSGDTSAATGLVAALTDVLSAAASAAQV